MARPERDVDTGKDRPATTVVATSATTADSNAALLPAGFHFEIQHDGPALKWGATVVASACPANFDSQPPWRICYLFSGPRYHFTATEE